MNAESPASSASVADRENPWPGLASFTEAQSSQFFGRDAEVKMLARRTQGDPLTVLFGQSGLGKSSLLQAGVFPRLRSADFCPIYLRLDHAPGAPTLVEQVKSLVKAGTTRAGQWTKPELEKPGESLWEFFHHRDNRLISPGGIALSPVLVFDQFEELFTVGGGVGAERQRAIAFMTGLAEVVENRPPEALVARVEESSAEIDAFDFDRTDYRVIITLREDYLPHLEGLKTIMPTLMDNRMRLSRMNGVQALEAVIKPGAGLVSEDVARAIVEFVAGARGGSTERLAELDVEPPLLSVICRELNERRRALGQAQITADLVTGNRREILTDFYERSVGDLPADMRAFVEDHLLTKSGFRDNLSLEAALEFPGVTRPLIDTLVSRRLLRIEDRLGVQRVELAHDVLAEVIRAARDARQRDLAVQAAQRGSRRQRWVISGLAVAVVALLIGAFFGLTRQRRAAAQASQTDFVLGSRLLDEGKLTEGLAYLVRAGTKDPANPLVAPRLLSALSTRRFLFPIDAPLSLPSPALGGGFAEDGRSIILLGEDGVMRTVDTATWQVSRTFDLGEKIRRSNVSFAPKSGDFAVLLADESLLVVDGQSGRPRLPPIRPPASIARQWGRQIFELSPDGRWLTAAGPEVVWIWDAASGDRVATLPANGTSRMYDISPDSRTLALIRDRNVMLWSLAERAFVGHPIASNTTILSPDFSADSRRVMLVNEEGAIVADAATGMPIRPLIPLAGTNSPATDFLLSDDGSKLINSTAGRTVVVLDVVTGKPLYPPLLHGGNVREMRLVEGGRTLFTNCIDGSVRLWDLETGKLRTEPTLDQRRFTPAAAAPDGRSVVLFSTAGPLDRLHVGGPSVVPLALPRERATTMFVNVASELPARLRWITPTASKAIDMASGRETSASFDFPESVTDARRSTYGPTLGAGDVVIVRTAAGIPRIWTMGDNRVAHDVPITEPPSARIALTNIAIDSGVKRLASPLDASGHPQARLLGIWDTETGRRLATIEASGPIQATNSIAFSPDGKHVVYRTTDDDVMHVTDISTGKTRFTLQLSGRAVIRTVRYRSDGRRILTGDTWGGVQVWDATTGTQESSTQHHRTSVVKFEFSPDRRSYASVANDGSVQVWDAVTDQPIGDLLEQSGSASRAEFSPDGTRIVTPSSSSSVRVWDVRTGLPVTDELSTEGDPTSVAAFSPDGRFLEVHGGASASGKQHIRVLPVPPAGVARTPDWLLNLATLCAGRRLTADGKLVGGLDDLPRLADVQRALAAAPADDPCAEWGRWLLSVSPNRSIGPGFTITPIEAKKLRADFMARPAR